MNLNALMLLIIAKKGESKLFWIEIFHAIKLMTSNYNFPTLAQ